MSWRHVATFLLSALQLGCIEQPVNTVLLSPNGNEIVSS